MCARARARAHNIWHIIHFICDETDTKKPFVESRTSNCERRLPRVPRPRGGAGAVERGWAVWCGVELRGHALVVFRGLGGGGLLLRTALQLGGGGYQVGRWRPGVAIKAKGGGAGGWGGSGR